MARYLVDTNALVFALENPARLSAAIRAIIEDGSLDVAGSAASLYEIGNKHRLGKIALSAETFWDGVRAMGIALTPVVDRVFVTASSLVWANRDPFDRIIAAQALHDGAKLITSDAAFDGLGGIERVW